MFVSGGLLDKYFLRSYYMFIRRDSFILPINNGFDPTVRAPYHTYTSLHTNLVVGNSQGSTAKTIDLLVSLDWLWFQAVTIIILVVLYIGWFVKTWGLLYWNIGKTCTDPRIEWRHAVLTTNGILISMYLVLSTPSLVDTAVGKLGLPFKKHNYCDFLNKPSAFGDSQIGGPLCVKKIPPIENPLFPKLLGYQKKHYVYFSKINSMQSLRIFNPDKGVYLGGCITSQAPLVFAYKTLIRGIVAQPKIKATVFEIFKIGITPYKKHTFLIHEQRVRFFKIGTKRVLVGLRGEILKQGHLGSIPDCLILNNCSSAALSRWVVVSAALSKVIKKIDHLRYEFGFYDVIGVCNKNHLRGLKFTECEMRNSSRGLKIGLVWNTLKIYSVVRKQLFGGKLNDVIKGLNLVQPSGIGLGTLNGYGVLNKLQKSVTEASLRNQVNSVVCLYKHLYRDLRTGPTTLTTVGRLTTTPHVDVCSTKQRPDCLLDPATLLSFKNSPIGDFKYRIDRPNAHAPCPVKTQRDLSLTIFKSSINYLLRLCPLENGGFPPKWMGCITKLWVFNRWHRVLAPRNLILSDIVSEGATFVESKKNKNLSQPVQISRWLVHQILTFLILERLNTVLLLKNLLIPRTAEESVFGQMVGKDFNAYNGLLCARSQVTNLFLGFRKQRRRILTRRYWTRNYINDSSLVGVSRIQLTRHHQPNKPIALRSSKEVMVGLSGFRKNFNPGYQWWAPRRKSWLRSLILKSRHERLLGAYTGAVEFQNKNTKQQQVLGMRRAATVAEMEHCDASTTMTSCKSGKTSNKSQGPKYCKDLYKLNKYLWSYQNYPFTHKTPYPAKQILLAYVLTKINQRLYIGGHLTRPELIIRNRVSTCVRGFITGLVLWNLEKQGFLKTTQFVIDHPTEHPVKYNLEFLLYNPTQPSRPRHIVRRPLNRRESFTPASDMVPLGVSGRIYGTDIVSNPRTWAENYKTMHNAVTARQKYNKSNELCLWEMPCRWDSSRNPLTNGERAWFSVIPRAKQLKGPVKIYSQLLGIDLEHYTSYRFWKWYLRESKSNQHILHTWVGYIEHLGVARNLGPRFSNVSNYHYFVSVVVQKLMRVHWWTSITEPFTFRYLQRAEMCGVLPGSIISGVKKPTSMELNPPYSYYKYPTIHCSQELSHRAVVRRFDRMKGVNLFKGTTRVTLRDLYSTGSTLQKPQIYVHEGDSSDTYTQRRRLWTKRVILKIAIMEIRNRR